MFELYKKTFEYYKYLPVDNITFVLHIKAPSSRGGSVSYGKREQQ
jgi:hypothetical protein